MLTEPTEVAATIVADADDALTVPVAVSVHTSARMASGLASASGYTRDFEHTSIDDGLELLVGCGRRARSQRARLGAREQSPAPGDLDHVSFAEHVGSLHDRVAVVVGD
jgi:hypothetical protein